MMIRPVGMKIRPVGMMIRPVGMMIRPVGIGTMIMPVQRNRFKALALWGTNGKTTQIEKYTESVGEAQSIPYIASDNHYGAIQVGFAIVSFSTFLLKWVMDKFAKDLVEEASKHAVKKWPGNYNAYESMGSDEVGVKRCSAGFLLPTAESKVLQAGCVISVGMRKNVKSKSIMDALLRLLWNQPGRVLVGMMILYARSRAKNLYMDDEVLDDMVGEHEIVGQLVWRLNGGLNLQPFNDRVLIQVGNGKEFKQYHVGRVVAFGTGVVKDGRKMRLPLAVGDKVLYSRTFASEGAEQIVIRMSDIHLVI